jgi:hypothetical protein
MQNEKSVVEFWNAKAKQVLVGKTIESARYITQDEADAFGWYKRCLLIRFNDGSYIMPMMDDEGNDSGSIQGYNPNYDSDMSFPTL